MNTTYTMKQSRDLAMQVNDSFPNATRVLVESFHGMPRYSALILLESTVSSKVVAWHYGNDHPIKIHQIHVELRPKALIKFIEDLNVEFPKSKLPLLRAGKKYCVSSKGQDLSYLEFVERLSKIKKIEYLLFTPSSVLFLFKKGLINMEDLFSLFVYITKNKLTDNYLDASELLTSFYGNLKFVESVGGSNGLRLKSFVESLDEKRLNFQEYSMALYNEVKSIL